MIATFFYREKAVGGRDGPILVVKEKRKYSGYLAANEDPLSLLTRI